jgi:hypothetical protein
VAQSQATLVGDPDRSDRTAQRAHALGEHHLGDLPDLRRVVLDPAWLGEVLRELAIGPAYGSAGGVDGKCPDAGGPGVDGDDDRVCNRRVSAAHGS